MDTIERLHFHFSLSCIGEGNGNPLQRSCLENPKDGGAWWAAVYGVAQSWTRLKRLSSSSSSMSPKKEKSSQANRKQKEQRSLGAKGSAQLWPAGRGQLSPTMARNWIGYDFKKPGNRFFPEPPDTHLAGCHRAVLIRAAA